MNRIVSLSPVFVILLAISGCATTGSVAERDVQTVSARTVQAGCGMCIYEMPHVEGCELAVKIDGQPYLVSGLEVDTHGLGMCNAELTATIVGEVVDDKFAATSFEVKK